VRIIAGQLGGRLFEAPSGHRTHPMAEKIRGALFSALGDIDGLTVLDAYTGSGALGFEAVSRGAKHVTAVDIDKSAITTVVNNISELEVEGHIKAIRANISGWLTTNPDALFDIILVDPPYDMVKENVLQSLAERLSPLGIIVYSLPPGYELSLLDSRFKLLSSKSYGDATLAFYRKIS